MGLNIDTRCCNNFGMRSSACPITAEDIHKFLSEAYVILTDCQMCFEERKEKIACLEKKHRCFVNINYPYKFSFTRDCFGYEYLIYIATIADFAIDMVVYNDLYGWIVLNTGTCVRKYNFGGCSKLQYSVSKRRDLCGDDRHKYDMRIAEIERKRVDCDFYGVKDVVLDWRCKPRCEFIEPCHGSKVDEKFAVLVRISNWNMRENFRHARLYVDDHCLHTIYNCDLFYVDLCGHKKGWHTLTLKLYDENGKFIGIGCEQKVCLSKAKKECSSSSSSSCCPSSSSSSCSSSSSSSCCPSSSSSSSCSSSSSSSCCPSSSSSSCSSSSSSSSCCPSSSSSSCSSSSSSSCQPPSSSSEESSYHYKFQSSYCCSSSSCPSSSSSSCPSSSSSTEMKKCKKFKGKRTHRS